MSLREAWTVVSGQDDLPVVVGPLVAYVLAFAAGLLLQRACRPLLPAVLYSYASDFIFTMVVCSYPYSHGLVRSMYGHVGYIVVSTVLVMVSCVAFEGTPSPLGVFTRYLKGEESLAGLVSRVVVQVLGAFLSYRLVYAIWSLEVTREHQFNLKHTACQSDLQVPVVLGFLIEFSAVLYDTWLSKHCFFKSKALDDIVKNVNGAVLVCAGMQMTGMYMHPALASGMTFNCKGTDTLEHVFVYWVGSFLGVFAGEHLHSVFHLPLPYSFDAAVHAKKTDKDTKKTEVINKKADRDGSVNGRVNSADMLMLENNNVRKGRSRKVGQHEDDSMKQRKKRVSGRKEQ